MLERTRTPIVGVVYNALNPKHAGLSYQSCYYPPRDGTSGPGVGENGHGRERRSRGRSALAAPDAADERE